MDLNTLREKIDAVDDALTALLTERLELVEQVAEYKKETNTPVLHANREKDILNKVEKSGEKGAVLAQFYAYLLEISRIRQTARIGKKFDLSGTFYPDKIRDDASVTVGCPGLSGAFSSIATRRLFPASGIKYYDTFEQVFSSLSAGEVTYGVIPTHNSNAGSVPEVYDYMSRYRAYIVNSLKLEIKQNLLGFSGADKRDIQKVYSHPQSLAQCKAYLAKSLPQAQVVPMTNNAIAAEYVAERGDPTLSALASEECAQNYGLTVLDAGVQDSEYNCTNFAVLAKQPNFCPKNDQISIIASLPHETGTLYKLLTKFYANDLNLTKIESRPIPGKDFEFLFYLDFNGNMQDSKVSTMLAGIADELPFFKFLGNY